MYARMINSQRRCKLNTDNRCLINKRLASPPRLREKLLSTDRIDSPSRNDVEKNFKRKEKKKKGKRTNVRGLITVGGDSIEDGSCVLAQPGEKTRGNVNENLNGRVRTNERGPPIDKLRSA